MIHILLSQPGGYRDVIEHLVASGAKVTNLGPDDVSPSQFRGKFAILASMFSRKIWRARTLWTRADRVLVIGWQALPVLAAIKLGILPRPHKILVMACFVHSAKARRIINVVWKGLRFPELGFITFSPGEARNLVDNVGIPAASIYQHLWRQELNGRVDQQTDDGSIFTGGYSNRDYDLLLSAAADVPAPLVIVASSRNQISAPVTARTTILRDLPETEFEQLLAKSRVVAMPLKSQGEACGQSVLLRVLRNGKPLVATRHESIEEYLGRDYPGFVDHDDVAAMRATLQRALSDDSFRATLADTIRKAGQRLEQRGSPGQEIEQFLLA
ncbi:glycosyltransferase family 1 protein [Massilia arenosa]|uniref:Glycosyltransferase family 1 protein n=1 Tax=Zemynaea arenosa TaxID=2561931 RepID=A0A4Y9SE85_9BURK|nr:glycosyltransferase family 1 protein [Massilia arenosa]